VAPLHRVLTHDTKKRYSAPFFYNPSYNCLVTPLVQSPHDEAKYHPVLWGYFRAVRFAGDLTNLGVEIQIEHFLKQPEDPASEKEDTTGNNETKQQSDHLQKQEVFAKVVDFKVPFSVEKFRPLLVGS
jgi:hypothetical protein